MSHNLIKNTSLYTLGNILPQVVGFLLLPVYTRYLTPGDYGIVSSMCVLTEVAAIIFTLALERSLYRLYWDYQTEEGRREFLSTVALSLCVISLLELLLFFLGRSLISKIFVTIDFYPFYLYAILGTFFSVFSHIPKIHLQLEQKAEAFLSISLLEFSLTTGCILWFVVLRKEGAAGMLKGRMLGPVLVSGIFILMTLKRIDLRFNPRILKETLSYSIPLVPTMLSAWVLNLSDRIFLERYFSLEDVGIYSLGYSFGELVLLISGSFSKAYNPVYFKLANSTDQEDARERLYRYNNHYLMFLLAFSFMICLFVKEVMVIFLDPRYWKAYTIVPIIVLAYFIDEISHLLNLSIYQEKKTGAVMYFQMAGALMNIGLNYLMVPPMGAYGAAYATALSFAGIFGLKYWYAQKCYFIPFRWRQLICGILIAVGILAVQSIIPMNIYHLLGIKILVLGFILGYIARRYYGKMQTAVAGT